jgi:hypothetical protein
VFVIASKLAVDAVLRKGKSDFGVYVFHFCDQDEAKARAATDSFIDDVLEQDAHQWWRLQMKLKAWPFPAAKIGDDRFSYAEQLAVATAIFNDPQCDVDEGVVLKLREFYAGPRDLVSCAAFKSLMQAWSWESPICNMDLERLLARIRKSSPGNPPHVERLLSSGFLSQVLHTHTMGGGEDPRLVSRKAFLQEGVPLRAGRTELPREPQPQKRRKKLLAMNEKISQACRERLRIGQAPYTIEQINAARADICTAFESMPEADRERFAAQAQDAPAPELDSEHSDLQEDITSFFCLF